MLKNNHAKTMNFMKLVIFIIVSVGLTACSITTKRKDRRADLPIPSTGELPHRVDLPDDGGEGAEPPAIPDVKVPKIGVILGPGGARTYAYIGVLREFEKANIPIYTIAGVEWGALIAGLYSVNGKAHEVEWKASKIPNDFGRSGFLSSSAEPVAFSTMDSYLKVLFENARVESGKIPFSCITDNLKTFKSQMLFKGTYRDTIGFCLGQPPIVRSKAGWVSSSFQTRYLMDQMMQRGVDYIVLVDVLTAYYPFRGAKVDEATLMLWSNINKTINKDKKYVHQNISVPISKNILDFNSRKEFIQQGHRVGKEAVKKIIEQFGL